MDSRELFFPLFSLFILSFLLGQGSAGRNQPGHHYSRPSKFFVFGDSYVDTGNVNSSNPNHPIFPYGITYPGKPDGRFSDGRVLTDYLASFLGLKTPITYSEFKKNGFKASEDGVNFAYGGTGVFDTSFKLPNMSIQIDYFQNLIANHNDFPVKDIKSSLALISTAGNDYSFYFAHHEINEEIKTFIVSVVNQITVNLKRIHGFGVKKIVVTSLEPVGCYPLITTPSFGKCNETMNSFVDYHNTLLKEAVAKLNKETKNSPFTIFEMNGAFSSIIQKKGKVTFKTPLKPCCFGVSKEFSCGSVDKSGNKKYELCEDRKSAFFWDASHPTQEGWNAVFNLVKSNLNI